MKLDMLSGKEKQMNFIMFGLNTLLPFVAFMFIRYILGGNSKDATVTVVFNVVFMIIYPKQFLLMNNLPV